MALTETRLGKLLGIGSGTGSRPAAGQTGARWIDTSTTPATETADTGTAWVAVGGGAGVGGTSSVLLDYMLATDVSGLSVPATSWTDMCANQSFTVARATSVVEIAAGGRAIVGTSSGETGCRLVIDSAGTPIDKFLGGAQVPGGSWANPFSGASVIALTGLSVGTHTVKVQFYTSAAETCYLSASSVPNLYGLHILVLERVQ